MLTHVIKITVYAIWGSVFQACIPISGFVIVRFIEAKLLGEPFHFVITPRKANYVTSWTKKVVAQ